MLFRSLTPGDRLGPYLIQNWAVVDFDKATRDPSRPTQFLPEYDSSDHLHPSDAGYQVVADSVDLAIFGAKSR